MNRSKKIAFFGCKNVSKTCMEKFQKEIDAIDYLITIHPEMGKLNKVAGYMDLTAFATKNNIAVYQANSYSLQDEQDLETIKKLEIDIGFAIGWQRLIPKEILEEVKVGVFGMHGSADNLPKGRGRSPMNWALILGRNNFFTNLFKYEDNVDGGGVLDTYRFEINSNDTIETLHFKNMLSMHTLIKKNFDAITANNFCLTKQDESEATYFPKRNPEDGFVDWNIKTEHIINLSRALAYPFPGCFSKVEGHEFTIWRMEKFSDSFDDSGAKPGEVLEVFYNHKFVVKTGDSSVIIHDYKIEDYSLIKAGKVLKSVNYRKVYTNIITRYYPFVKKKQKEITLDIMLSFYE